MTRAEIEDRNGMCIRRIHGRTPELIWLLGLLMYWMPKHKCLVVVYVGGLQMHTGDGCGAQVKGLIVYHDLSC